MGTSSHLKIRGLKDLLISNGLIKKRIPITKELTWYALIDKWILSQKLRIAKIQFAKHVFTTVLNRNSDTVIISSYIPNI
jgi:hypothetical protein